MKQDRRNRRWTSDEYDMLVQLASGGKSLRQMSILLKRTKAAILAQGRKLGVQLGKKSLRMRGRRDMQDDLPLFNEHGRKIKNGDVAEVDGMMTTISVTATDDPFKRNPSKRIPFSQRVEKQKADYRKKMWGLVIVLMQFSVIIMGMTVLMAWADRDDQLALNMSIWFWPLTMLAMLVIYLERNLNDK